MSEAESRVRRRKAARRGTRQRGEAGVDDSTRQRVVEGEINEAGIKSQEERQDSGSDMQRGEPGVDESTRQRIDEAGEDEPEGEAGVDEARVESQ